MEKPKILIVDDEPRMSGVTRWILERLGGFAVHEENQSTAALDTARKVKPDLFVLDVNMPDLDGGDLARLIGADPKFGATPIIFLTSLLSAAEASRRPLGVRDGWRFLAKPVCPKLLVEAVSGALAAGRN